MNLKFVLGLSLALPAIFLAPMTVFAETCSSFIPLFNGVDLEGWSGDRSIWSVEDKAITGRASRSRTTPSYLLHAGGYAEFELQFRYRLSSPAGVSGFLYRGSEITDESAGVEGYKAVVAPKDAGPRFGMIWDEGEEALLAYLGEQVRIIRAQDGIRRDITGVTIDPTAVLNEAGEYPEWNDFTVVAYKHRLVHSINDHIVVDVTDDNPEGSYERGEFALILEAGSATEVQYKDIQVRCLEHAPEIFDGSGVSDPEAEKPDVTGVSEASRNTLAESEGRQIFSDRCAMCHDAGVPGVPTRETLARNSKAYVIDVLTNGLMIEQAMGLSDEEIDALAGFVSGDNH